jgi:hypothetical protein
MPVEFVIVGMSLPPRFELGTQPADFVFCTGVAFFDSAWSRSVSLFPHGNNVSLSTFFRRANSFSSSNPSAPPSS